MKRIIIVVLILFGLLLIPILTESEIEHKTKRYIRGLFQSDTKEGASALYILERDMHKQYDFSGVRIVMLGDSHTQFADWSRFLPEYKIAGLGIGGDTTDGMLARIDQVVAIKPRICFIMAGINDITRHRDMRDIQRDYSGIVTRLEDAGIRPVIFSTLFVAEHHYDPRRINARVEELNAYLKGLGCPFIDMTSDFHENGFLRPEYTLDGLHLKANGYSVWRDYIFRYLRQEE